jgi:hypothetical protein
MNELQEDLKVILKLAVKMYMELWSLTVFTVATCSNGNSRTCSHISSDCYGASRSRGLMFKLIWTMFVWIFFLFFWTRWTICKLLPNQLCV